MRPMAILGILLIVVGVLALAYPAITYTDRDEILDAGPIELATETEESIPIPPLVGGVAIAGGIGLLVFARRR